jgi:GNAT superfamily N-acetyltransferase
MARGEKSKQASCYRLSSRGAFQLSIICCIMSGTLRIRRMAETDGEVVATLAGELGYPNEAEAIRARIRAIGESDLLLVAVDEGDKPVGFIQAHRVCIIEVGFRVEILELVASSSARRSGIGRRLIAEAERWAESIGAEAISVRSSTKRIEAHLFYPALGYKKIKTQAVYEKHGAGAAK